MTGGGAGEASSGGTVLELHGAAMRSMSDLHEQVAGHPATPDTYARDFDALFDVLVAHYRPPIHIRWYDAPLAKKRMGRDFPRAVAVIEDAAGFHRTKGKVFELELIEGPAPA